jgi:pSer/pThr/pTyr-binding forkhead associated (FHA) protein
MKISVRRQGVPVKSITATTTRLRIGSGDECEIHLNDPFLATLVAELVLRDDEWRIVDAGTSLEGCTRSGVRVNDEPVEPGQIYVVGSFEFVTDANAGRRGTFATRAANDELIPKTMIGEALPGIPKTMMQPLDEIRGDTKKGGAGKLHFEPVASAPAPGVSRAPAAQRKGSPLVIVVAAVLVVIVGGILIISKSPSPKPKASTTAKNDTAPAPVATASVPTPPPAVDASLLAKNLEIDKTFDAWESSASGANADPQLKQRIVSGAFELGRAYAASNDTTNANRYFEKVIRYGQPESAEVQYVRARLHR